MPPGLLETTLQGEPGGFDRDEAMRHVARLSRPRRAGTIEERRAVRYVLQAFGRNGLTRWREPFLVPVLWRAVIERLVYIGSVVCLLAGLWVVASQPLASAACWSLAAVLINSPWRLSRLWRLRFPGGFQSENVVAVPPGGLGTEAPARVIFMAHYDSKSQTLPTGVRVGLVAGVTGLCLALAAVALGASIGLVVLPRMGALWLAAGVVVAAVVGLASNLTGNRSPGALDNATGVAVLLELACHWRPEEEFPIEVRWVATGAEELGLHGARAYLARHEEELREKPTLVINLDSVGVGPRLYLAGEREAMGLAAAVAGRLGIAWSRLRVMGAGMDHEPFASRGLAAISVLGDVMSASLTMHSPRDTIDRVEPLALERTALLAGELAHAWGREHRSTFREPREPVTNVVPSAHRARDRKESGQARFEVG